MNYCTNFFPDQGDFYNKDAIATAGWTQPAYPDFPCTAANPCAVTYTPNVLIGDVFYVDTATQGGNVSGDPAVALEFDSRLPYHVALTKTFFGKFVDVDDVQQCADETTRPRGCTSFIDTYAAAVPVPRRRPRAPRRPLRLPLPR